MMTRIWIACCLLVCLQAANGQNIWWLDSSRQEVSFRGLAAVSANVAWVSGSRGAVGRTLDGANTWEWVDPKGHERRDFRGIHAFDERTAIVMAVDSPGLILRTTDGGRSWQTVYERHIPGIFLDALSFRDSLRGWCIGDPVDGHFWITETKDGGKTWQDWPLKQRPRADSAEACFAASGTNLQWMDHPDYEAGFVSGGWRSRLWLRKRKTGTWEARDIPIRQYGPSSGANSWCWVNGAGWIAGGNFSQPTDRSQTLAIWTPKAGGQAPKSQLPWYASCIVPAAGKDLLACGTQGIAIMNTASDAQSWRVISQTGVHVAARSPDGEMLYLAGPRGRLARIRLNYITQ